MTPSSLFNGSPHEAGRFSEKFHFSMCFAPTTARGRSFLFFALRAYHCAESIVLIASEFDDFQVFDFGFVDDETDECADLLESADAGGSGVYVEAVQVFIVYHFQDVRMAADE